MGRPGKHARPRSEVQVDILNRLTLAPSLKGAARDVGINPSTIFKWINESIGDPSITLDWLGHRDTFANLVNLARKLQIVVMEHEARSLATIGHAQPRWHDGAPCYKHDAKIEADALSMDDLDWDFTYGVSRKREDVFARDENGALIPEEVVSPPNSQLLVKMLASLVPGYAEKSELSVTHAGHVWIEGGTPEGATSLPAAPSNDFNQSFGLTPSAATQVRPTNVLAISRPCKDSAEFDSLYRKKLLRDVVLFRDADGKLLAPLPDDLIVAGSVQARAFEDAGIVVEVVHPTVLIDEGFENPWLKALAPGHKPKFIPPTPEQNLDVAVKAAARMAAAENPYVSMEARAEGIGAGRPAPGGRSILR